MHGLSHKRSGSALQTARIILLILLNLLAIGSLTGTSWIYDFSLFRAASITELGESQQLVLVTGTSWSSFQGKLERFERRDSHSAWEQVGPSLPVAMGARGFAWGIGLHPREGFTGPVMDEGDRRTPAGIFRIVSAFGRIDRQDLADLKLPYQLLTPEDICVDDPSSRFYNQIINGHTSTPRDWRSAEPMVTADTGYRLGVVFDQNPLPVAPRRGSCLFLHVGPDEGGTFGCTTLNEERMKEIALWLDPQKKPLMVQLPAPVLRQTATAWGLPEHTGGTR